VLPVQKKFVTNKISHSYCYNSPTQLKAKIFGYSPISEIFNQPRISRIEYFGRERRMDNGKVAATVIVQGYK
jgi:hypothetical protein